MVKDISRSLLSKAHAAFGDQRGRMLSVACQWPKVKGIFCLHGLAGIEDWVRLAISSMVACAVHPSCDVQNTAPHLQLSPHEFGRLLHRLGSACSIILNGWASVICENVMCNLAWC